MELHAILILIGTLHGFFLAFTLVVKAVANNTANYYLALILFIISLYLLEHYFILENLRIKFPHFTSVPVALTYLIAPLLYFYVKAVLGESIKLNKKNILHFIPAIICFLSILPFFLESTEYKIFRIANFDPNNFQLPANRAVYFGLLLIQLAIYLYLARKYLNKKNKILDKRSFKNINVIVNWLRFFLYGITIFLLCYFIVFLMFITTDYNLSITFYTLLLVPALFIHFIAYWTIKESLITQSIGSEKSNDRYKNSTLSKNKVDNLKTELLNIVGTEKIYRDSSVSLQEVSKLLSINSRYLSQLVNQEFNRNFTDFINSYRVNETIALFKNKKYENWDLLSIAMEAGFSNKNTFIRVFKQHTNQLPSDFRKSLNKF